MLVLAVHKPGEGSHIKTPKNESLNHLSHLFLLCLPRMSEKRGSSSIWYLSRYSYSSSVPSTFCTVEF